MEQNERDIKEKVKDVFGRNAEKYVVSELHAKGGDLVELVDWLQPSAEWTVLDVATGGGHVAKALSPHAGRVVACDLTREMLEASRRHLEGAGCRNVLYVVGDAEGMPFLDGAFDAVTCRIAPHHFPHPDRFVAEGARVLRSGGRFLLIDNVAPEEDALDAHMNTVEKLRDRSHVRCAKVSEWREWFRAAGLIEERAVLKRKTFQFPTWVARTAESEEQMAEVEAFLLAASPEVQANFNVRIENGRVLSFEIDEWMTVYQKA